MKHFYFIQSNQKAKSPHYSLVQDQLNALGYQLNGLPDRSSVSESIIIALALSATPWELQMALCLLHICISTILSDTKQLTSS